MACLPCCNPPWKIYILIFENLCEPIHNLLDSAHLAFQILDSGVCKHCRGLAHRCTILGQSLKNTLQGLGVRDIKALPIILWVWMRSLCLRAVCPLCTACWRFPKFALLNDWATFIATYFRANGQSPSQWNFKKALRTIWSAFQIHIV